ncbi:glucuronate isomerase [Pseudoroseicyclus sp. H15]
MPKLDPDRLFPVDERSRRIARALYERISGLPILSPHGHTDPAWFAENQPFPDPATLFVKPDHYVFRMLFSQGVRLEDLGVPRADGGAVETDGRKIWRCFSQHYHLLRGTPSRLWLDYSFENVFGLEEPFGPDTADAFYDHIDAALKTEGFRPRALFERFNIEAIATTEGPLDDLRHHRAIRESGWGGRVLTAYRPDAVVDPDVPGFADNLARFGEITGEDVGTWAGYLAAHRNRRAYFIEVGGATASDHGHPTAHTENLGEAESAALYETVRTGRASAAEKEAFRGQMLTEMARMSLDDGLVLQIHAGSRRSHSPQILQTFGTDKGFDIPGRIDFVGDLKPLLNAHGLDPRLTIIVFMLDESTQSRELAPLAGVYPALKLGPPWWFYDSPEGMMRFRQNTTETAGFYNTVGFNDDTRAYLSIPARHDVARRVDCAYLAGLVATGRLGEDEAHELAYELTYGLAKAAYRL